MNRKWIVTLVSLVLVLIVSIFYFDQPIAFFLRERVPLQVREWMRPASKICMAQYWIMLGLMLWLYPLLAKAKNSAYDSTRDVVQYRLVAIYLLLSVGISSLIVYCLKQLIGRYRPTMLFEQGMWGYEPFNSLPKADSFPSGHTQTIWSAMLPLVFIFPQLKVLFIIVAITGGLSRVVLLRHYLSDVIGGVIIAIACAVWLKSFIESRWGALYNPRVKEEVV